MLKTSYETSDANSDRAATWTVGRLAELTGVTVRTLHHYDQIGLLSPTERTYAGYRLYTEADLARLQRIVVYLRLEMPLEEIAALLDGDDDPVAHLRRQREAVMSRLGELTELEFWNAGGSGSVESSAADPVVTEVAAGQSIVTRAGERVRYSTGPDGAEYVAVCTPAFAPETVHREET